jgi:hypothetical protein
MEISSSKIKNVLAILLATLFVVSLTALVAVSAINLTIWNGKQGLGSSNFRASSANVAPVATATDGSTGNIGGFDSPLGHGHNMGGFVSSMSHGHGR